MSRRRWVIAGLAAVLGAAVLLASRAGGAPSAPAPDSGAGAHQTEDGGDIFTTPDGEEPNNGSGSDRADSPDEVSEDPDNGSDDNGEQAAPPEPSLSECATVLPALLALTEPSYEDLDHAVRDLGASVPAEGIDGFFKHCLTAHQAVFIVWGLPDVAGLFMHSPEYEMLLGFGFVGVYDGNGYTEGVGRCFVAPEGIPFRTVASFYGSNDVQIDIDVGFTQGLTGGEPDAVVGVNRFVGNRVESAYVSGPSGAEVKVKPVHRPSKANPWAGFAFFETKLSNTPIGAEYPVQIALWCGG
jgi:hypothetical protein